MTTYEPIIGLEIHAELMTNSKMFCGCRVVDSVTAEPNTAVCPVCLGMPGMLPVINQRAVEFALRVALALNCTIQPHNIFARKNYFYPDLPKAYQISQYELPIGTKGWIEVELEGGHSKRIGIRRVHMEEDTGKLTHLEQGGAANSRYSLVDYNRSGVPLLEIVSEPEIHSGEEARAYGLKIRQILRYLEVNSGDMEKGVLRVEPNISLRPVGTAVFGTRTELKNLNSFKSLADGTAFEIARQTELLNQGGRVVQETRGWHDTKRITFSQRSKEEAEDYRYFPEPDLPPLHIAPDWITAVQTTLPELPDMKAHRYQSEYALSEYDARILTEERQVAEWFETAVTAAHPHALDPKTIANWIINTLFSLMNEQKQSIGHLKVTPAGLIELLTLLDKATITQATAKEVLAEMVVTGHRAPDIVATRGLAQLSDTSTLTQVLAQIIANKPQEAQAYQAGKTQLRGWFVGQVMKATQGKANPTLVNQLLDQLLPPHTTP